MYSLHKYNKITLRRRDKKTTVFKNSITIIIGNVNLCRFITVYQCINGRWRGVCIFGLFKVCNL